MEVAQQRKNYVSFIQRNIFEILTKILSIRAILFKYFENRKLPFEIGTPWGPLLKCRMIASNQHSNVFWTFIFIRSFFMIPLPHIVCLRRNQAGKIVKIMQQANGQQYFDEFFCGRHNRPRETFWDSGDFPSLAMWIRGGQSSNVSTTPITAMGCWQPLSVVQLKGKHCHNGVVDMIWKSILTA